jgi:hypothetical protein
VWGRLLIIEKSATPNTAMKKAKATVRAPEARAKPLINDTK